MPQEVTGEEQANLLQCCSHACNVALYVAEPHVCCVSSIPVLRGPRLWQQP